MSTTNPEMLLVGQTDPRFKDRPAYGYVLASDELPRWDRMGDDPLVKVKLFDPLGRFTYYVTGFSNDSGHRYVSGYCVSPLGPDCDEHGDMGADELEQVRNRLGLPLERDILFRPLPESELLRRLRAGEHV